jgi:hypothetical protein
VGRARSPPHGREWGLYVSDADALYAEWEALENLEGPLIAPRDTPYGLREFAYVDPDGTAYRIGSPLTP